MPFSTGPRPAPSGRWQVMQLSSVKSFSPASTGDSGAGPPASQTWYSSGSITTILPIIFECSVPQYSAQKRW